MGEIDRKFSENAHINDIFKSLVNIKKRRESETGVVIFSGRQGTGKTTSMIEYLNRLHKVYGDLLQIYSNMDLIKWNDGTDIEYIKLSPEDIYNIHFDNTKQNVCVIDEISTLFIALTGQRLDADVYQAFCQLRKRDCLIISTAQVYTRIVTAIREQCTLCIKCNRLWFLQINTIHDLDDSPDIETLPDSKGFYMFVPYRCYQGFDTRQIIRRKDGRKRG